MDCSITLNYAHELKRMCGSYHICSTGCPFSGDKRCLAATSINASRIEAVQKWSDAHPETEDCRENYKGTEITEQFYTIQYSS